MSKARGATRKRGFTLVEVLAALVLLGIVLPVAMRGIALAVNLAATARQREEAAILASSKLNEIVATSLWQNAALSGDFDSQPDYHWAAELHDWDRSTLKQLDVHVFWKFGNNERQVTLSTLLETNN